MKNVLFFATTLVLALSSMFSCSPHKPKNVKVLYTEEYEYVKLPKYYEDTFAIKYSYSKNRWEYSALNPAWLRVDTTDGILSFRNPLEEEPHGHYQIAIPLIRHRDNIEKEKKKEHEK